MNCFRKSFEICHNFSILIPLSAQAANITITINGQNVVFEQKPIIKNNIALVPMRAFFEALGC
ncbi:stalk domain-containing protein [Caldanaerobacter subterraneus]|uniref:stalk domain-containing protein n=1 Tax=Caldanaerobacter subterraneus TaxID=911092 RepID=UPI0002D56BF3|nr:stalk domain-containing protein [Caldanaerobacter subterraneus]